ncbi:hypothetical protein ScPMuIL_008546 [Solemya velum]
MKYEEEDRHEIKQHSSCLNCEKANTKMIYQILLVIAVFVVAANSFLFGRKGECRYSSECSESHSHCINRSLDFCRSADRNCVCRRGCLLYNMFMPRGRKQFQNEICTCDPYSKSAILKCKRVGTNY